MNLSRFHQKKKQSKTGQILEHEENPDRQREIRSSLRGIHGKFSSFLPCAMALFLCGATTSAQELPDVDVNDTPGQLFFSQEHLLATEEETLSLHRYTLDGNDRLRYEDPWTLHTWVNYISPETQLQFQALDDDVWLYVQYLTDINGDGHYEWVLDEDNLPIWFILSKGNTLTPTAQATSWHKMGESQSRSLSASHLFQYSLEQELQRDASAESLDDLDYSHSGNTMFCFTFSSIPLHLGGNTQEETVEESIQHSYYIKIDPKGYENTSLLGAYHLEDVAFSDDYFQAVDFCLKTEILPSISVTEFAPDQLLTRYQVIEAMYRSFGSPVTAPRSFSDLDQEQWYASSFTWAVSRGIVGAIGGSLRPEAPITREEFISILYNYGKIVSKLPTSTTRISTYTDGKTVDSRYKDGVLWGLDVGLLTVDEKGNISPEDTLTRGEASVILLSFFTLLEDS